MANPLSGVCPTHCIAQYAALTPTAKAKPKVTTRDNQTVLESSFMGRIIIEAGSITNTPSFSTMPHPNLPQRRLSTLGFTLIELMVVLVIIGVLAALIVPNVLDRADDARTTAARTDIANLGQALKLYRLDNQRYPTAEQGLGALVAKPSTGPIPSNWRPYLDKLPNDPWARPYVYLNPGIKGEIDILSFGADGQAGGEGNNADIGSWQ
jgi:general secretion pathway protein G